MEASVVDEGMDDLIALCRDKNIVTAPSCTMRFQPSIRKMKQLLDEGVIGKVLACTHHLGQYLPDWHPWENYRAFYASKKATGAGREMVAFELVGLTWLLGDVESVACMKGKLTSLETDIDDVYQLLLKFQRGCLGSVLIEVVSRVPYRTCRLISEEGILHWDWSSKAVRVYRAQTGTWKAHEEAPGTVEKDYVNAEEPYVEEMAHFLDAIRGNTTYMYTLEEDRRILEILYKAEESDATGCRVEVETQI
jgi:predicted dehydrogenase